MKMEMKDLSYYLMKLSRRNKQHNNKYKKRPNDLGCFFIFKELLRFKML